MRHKLIEFRGNRTQEEMARIYKVTQQAWSNWETGKDTPRPVIMMLIARDANSSIEELFFNNDNNGELLKRITPTGTEGK